MRLALILFLGLSVVVNGIYWQDPWYWRRYVNLFLDPGTDAGLKPFETIRGDNGFALDPPPESASSVDADALAAAVDYAKAFDSFALLVVHRGRLVLEWYREDFDRERLTESQSMHKTLVALMIGAAIDDGSIRSVDDPVGDYVEEWRDDPRGAITLRQLLQMSSGLSQPPFSLNPFRGGLDWLNASDSVTPLLATPLADWPAGERYEYNNLNSELLGLVVERATGRRYASYLEEKLWRPMGGDRAQVWLDSEGGKAHTSCCLAAPAIDWARIGLVLLGRGAANGAQLFDPEWIDQMTTPSANAPHYGYQTWLGYGDPPFPPGAGSTEPIASEPYRARDTFLTWGRGQQHVWVIPSRELVIVRVGQALGRQPIEPGFDVPKIPNLIVDGLVRPEADPSEHREGS